MARSCPRFNPPISAMCCPVNDALKDGAGVVHIKINSQCEHLIRDLEEMREDEDGMPDKSNAELSHASDATGYLVSAFATRCPNPCGRISELSTSRIEPLKA